MRFDPYKDTRGEWRWRVVADNGRIVADSSEGYENREDMLYTARMVLGEKFVDAAIADVTPPD